MNNLQVFNSSQFGQVRTLESENKILFCGSDIAKALGYTNTSKALNDHCKAITKRYTPTSSGNQEMSYITESDVYRLISHSKLPSAEKFESWVFDEVLPTIRKTGGYVSNEDAFIHTYLPNADDQTKLLFKSTLETVRSLNSQIEANKPKVLFADAVATAKTSILVGELAKILKQNGFDTGEKRLFTWLRDNGYLIKRNGTDYNAPTQKSMDLGLFEVKETSISHSDGHVTVNKTTKVTGKGQQYFINKFLEKGA